jgi:hypothetical protein
LSHGTLKWYKIRQLGFKGFLSIVVLGLLGLPTDYAVSSPGTVPGFSSHYLNSEIAGKTILIVGGIQGDEPGGFNAASLIVTHYKILSGAVRVVPNLNFPSIIKRSRGLYGDLNRKFDTLNPGDPEFNTIKRIKKMILAPEVDLVLNLHDGSGFYAKTHEDKNRHPGRWGQSIIVDQEQMPDRLPERRRVFFQLAGAAGESADFVNTRLLHPGHKFHVKNTRTAQGDLEMAKSLTYFALKNNKSAFGIEASKSLSTAQRVYYHLLAIEAFFDQAGIRFNRGFELTEAGISRAIDQDIEVALGENRILLTVENVRNRLGFIPLEKEGRLAFQVNHPLMTLVQSGDVYTLFHGNRRLTRLSPQYFDYDFGLKAIDMVVDGESRRVFFGTSVPVKHRFLVKKIPDHRVNIIGFSKKTSINESGFVVRKENFVQRFSIDKGGQIFRVEVYTSNRFNGMILVDFRTNRPDGPNRPHQSGGINLAFKPRKEGGQAQIF